MLINMDKYVHEETAGLKAQKSTSQIWTLPAGLFCGWQCCSVQFGPSQNISTSFRWIDVEFAADISCSPGDEV